jgi:hypothetical protein
MKPLISSVSVGGRGLRAVHLLPPEHHHGLAQPLVLHLESGLMLILRRDVVGMRNSACENR